MTRCAKPAGILASCLRKRFAPANGCARALTAKAGLNRSGAVLIFSDERGGIAHNWAIGVQKTFRAKGVEGVKLKPRPKPRDDRADQAEAAKVCEGIVAACEQRTHPYLEKKGFPEEVGLVLDDVRPLIPDTKLGRDILARLPQGDGLG